MFDLWQKKGVGSCMDVSIRYSVWFVHENVIKILKIWKGVKKKISYQSLISLDAWRNCELSRCSAPFFIVEEDLPSLKNKLIQLSYKNILWKRSLTVHWPFIDIPMTFSAFFFTLTKWRCLKTHECSQCTCC